MCSVPVEAVPVVSVITPNFNGARYLSRAVESVALQNYDSLEHIIVDDCSTDESWEILESLASKYSWLKIVRLNENFGPVVARNDAIDLARGRFLAFLDVDDFWLPSKISTQIDFMITNECVLSFTDYRYVSDDGKKIGRSIRGCNKIGWHLHHMTRYLGCLTIMVDRQKYPSFRFPDISADIRAEDFLAWSELIVKFGVALRCPYDLARYAVVDNSRSSNKMKASQSVWQVYRSIEKISLHAACFYFFTYAIGVIWKRHWHRPFMDRSKVDWNYNWSLLLDTKIPS
jgi:glycosyltransferase involved in cell wall biosynthesis